MYNVPHFTYCNVVEWLCLQVYGTTGESDQGISFVARSYRSEDGAGSFNNASVIHPTGKKIVVIERNKDLIGGMHFNNEDFTQIDHRLKLFLSMNFFGEHEEFSLLLKVSLVLYGFPCL